MHDRGLEAPEREAFVRAAREAALDRADDRAILDRSGVRDELGVALRLGERFVARAGARWLSVYVNTRVRSIDTGSSTTRLV
jgi:hypothetical protein